MLLEVFAEERLGREIEMVGDLLNTHAGVFEQRLGFQNHRFVDPARGGFAAHLLDHGREIFRRDIELLGVRVCCTVAAAT